MTDPGEAPAPRRALWWALGVVVLLTVIVVVAFTTRFGEDPNLVASPLVGSPVPDLVLPLVDGGGEVPVYEPGTVGVVNFWASWCLPCRREHGILVAAASEWEELGVRVVGVLYQDREDAGRAFLDALGRGYETVADQGSQAAIEYGVFGVPETYFIDRDGTVAAVIRGEVTEALVAATLEAVVLGQEVESVRTGTVQVEP